MLRQINVINLLLAGVLAFFIYMLLSLVNAALEFSLPSAKSHNTAIAEEGAKASVNAPPSPDDYMIVTEQNLFHPDRKMVASVKEGGPLVTPDFVLYGTMITDDENIAFLDDLKASYATMGRGKRQRAVHLGETLSGYTLIEIYHDMVVMNRDLERIEVKIKDRQPKKAKISETPAPSMTIQQKSGVQEPSKANNMPGTSSGSGDN